MDYIVGNSYLVESQNNELIYLGKGYLLIFTNTMILYGNFINNLNIDDIIDDNINYFNYEKYQVRNSYNFFVNKNDLVLNESYKICKPQTIENPYLLGKVETEEIYNDQCEVDVFYEKDNLRFLLNNQLIQPENKKYVIKSNSGLILNNQKIINYINPSSKVIYKDDIIKYQIKSKIIIDYYNKIWNNQKISEILKTKLTKLSNTIREFSTYNLDYDSNKCKINNIDKHEFLLNNRYEDNLSYFEILDLLQELPKINQEYFYVYRGIGQNLCINFDDYYNHSRNVITNLSLISTAYYVDFVIEKWLPFGKALMIIKVHKNDPYFIIKNQDQSEITLFPGYFVIKENYTLNINNKKRPVFICDYRPFTSDQLSEKIIKLKYIQINNKDLLNYIKDIEFNEEKKGELENTLLRRGFYYQNPTLRLPKSKYLGGYYLKYLKYKNKYLQLKKIHNL